MMLIVRFFYIFISSILSIMVYDCYFDKRCKFNLKKQWVILFIVTLLEVVIKNQFDHTVINLLSTAFTTFLICLVLYKGKFEVQILLSFLVLLINMILDILSILPVVTLLKHNIGMSGVESFVIVFTAVLFCLSKLMLVHIIRRKRIKTANIGDRYSYYQQIIIPAGSIIYSIYYVYSVVNQPYFRLFECYITIFFLVGVNVVHYIIFENKEKLYLENYKNLLLQQKYEYREEYYRNLKNTRKKLGLSSMI